MKNITRLQKTRTANKAVHSRNAGSDEPASERKLAMRKKATQQRAELKRLKLRGSSRLKKDDEERQVDSG